MSDTITDYDGNVVATTAPSTTIQQTIMAVMRAVRAVGKDGRNTAQNFNFRGIDAVMNAVGPAMREHGLMILPRVLQREVERGTTKSGGGMVSVRLTVEYVWMNEQGDSLATVVESEAFDTSDKGTAKAMSVALRTAILQVLALPTTDKDPDADYIERGNDRNPHLPSQQQAPQNVPLPTPEQVDAAANALDFNALVHMEKAALDAGDSKARTYIASARLYVKKQLAEQQQQADPGMQKAEQEAQRETRDAQKNP